MSARLANVDSVRGIAALGILVTHVTFATGLALTSGWGGWFNRLDAFLSVFFVLSGFVLFRPYAIAAATRGSWPGLRRYTVRRTLRIVPAFWLLIIVDLLLLVRPRVDAQTWLRQLTFTQYYVRAPLLPGVAVAWTLSVEVVFYAVLPLLAFALLRRLGGGDYRRWRPGTVAAGLLVAGIAISVGWLSQLWPGPLSPYIHVLWFPTYTMCFALGMAMAVASVALHSAAPPRWTRLLDQIGSEAWACWGLAVVCYGLSVYVAGPLGGIGVPTGTEYVIKELLYLGFAAFLLLPVVFGQNGLQRLLGHRVMVWLGTVSFGLFLWHLTVIEVIARVSGPLWGGNTLLLLLVTLVTSVGLAAISWYVVERSALRLADRLWRSGPRPQPAPVASQA